MRRGKNSGSLCGGGEGGIEGERAMPSNCTRKIDSYSAVVDLFCIEVGNDGSVHTKAPQQMTSLLN